MYFVEYLKISRICNANAVSRPGVRWSTIWFMGFQSQNCNKFFFFISDQRLHRFNLRFHAFKNEMVETVQHGNGWNAPKIKNFLVGQRPKQAFQKCVHLEFQKLLLSPVKSKLTTRSRCRAFLHLESSLTLLFISFQWTFLKEVVTFAQNFDYALRTKVTFQR